MSNEFKRVKHGQKPGDLPKGFKIAMREKRIPIRAAKTFRKILSKKGRKVQRRRDHTAEQDRG